MLCPSCQADNEESAESCFTCGKALYGLTRGAIIATRYVILTRLGRGAMGTVYWAHDRMLEEHVALKVLRPDIAPEMARRFRSEIKLARKISHKNVCRIHEYGEDGDIRYISMAYVEGVDLRRLVREQGPLFPDEAYEVAIQAAEGLHAIHEEGIVHRDLKASNIMRDEKGVVKLMDFGIAKQLGAATAATATGDIFGTPEYMSPEQARGTSLDQRSDIYSLGVVVFEIFTGGVPFHGDSPISTVLQHLQSPPPLEGPEAERLPKALVPVLKQALAKRPEERFATARDFVEALGRARRASFHDLVQMATKASSVASATAATPSTPAAPLAAAAAASRRPLAASQRDSDPRTRPVVDETRTNWMPSRQSTRGALALAAVAAVVLTAFGLRGAARTGTPSPPGESAASVTAPPAASPPAAAASDPTPRPSAAASAPTPAAPPPTTAPARLATPTPRPVATSLAPARPAPPTTLARATAPIASPPPASPPPPSVAPATQGQGILQLRVHPWAEVSVDGAAVGTSPLRPLPLAAGTHTVALSHPKYRLFERTITIRPGESTRLDIDLPKDGVPRETPP